MTQILRLTTVVLIAATLSAATAAAQTPNPRPVPTDESLDEARRRAREEAERAREAAERARDAARQVREQEAELRRARARANAGANRDDDRGPEFTDTFSRTVRIGRNGTLDLSNVAGDIQVTGGGGDDVVINAVKRVRRPTEADARALLQEIQILVNERGSLVEVRTEYPRNRRNINGEVDFTVTLPDSSNVIVRSVSGDVRVSTVRGELQAETVSGDVEATAIGRLRAARSVSGDIQLVNSQGEDVAAGTVSGNVVARNVKVRSIDIDAVSGDLRFSETEAERVNLRTISGDIDYAGRLARSGRYQMQSQSGDIRLTPIGDTGFDLDASAFSGTVRSNVQFRNNATVQTPRRGPRTETLRGTFGDATAVITLRSFSGDVSVMRN
jgi:DUF4097 and DUF4098 domain-containing protein YvlB